MITRLTFLFFITIIASCSSDNIITTEKNEFAGIFKNLLKNISPDRSDSLQPSAPKKTNQWLSRFKQPVILISSLNGKNQATLVALGNNKEKLTWVSADGISLTFDQGLLIATRGYSQDLISLKYLDPAELFKLKNKKYKKVHRYLTSDNEYMDIYFECSSKKEISEAQLFLEYQVTIEKFFEECTSNKYNYKNEYDLLSGTSIVIKSKQWISPVNESFITYNLYAFQKL